MSNGKLLPFRNAHKARRGRGRIVAVDLDGRKLRLAIATIGRRGRPRLHRMLSVPLPVDDRTLDLSDPEATGAWIAEALDRLRVRTTQAIMAVPRAKVILKPVILPPVDDFHELGAMVKLQVSRDLPFAEDYAIIDFTVQSHYASGGLGDEQEGAPESERVEVLAAGVEKSVVDYYCRLAAAAGLKLQSLGLRSYSNTHCLEYCQKIPMAEDLAFVSLRPDEITISVLTGRLLAFCRTASVGISDDTAFHTDSADREETLVATLAREVGRSLQSYDGMAQQGQVQHVLIAGDTGLEERVVAELDGQLGLSCERFDPGENLKLSAVQREDARGAVSVIGMASRAGSTEELPFDFLNPRKLEAPKDPHRFRKWLLPAAAALFALLLVGTGYAIVNKKKGALRKLAQDIQLERIATQGAEKPIRAAAAIKSWTQSDRRWLDHWAYVSAILPPCTDLYVGSFQSSAAGSIRLSVQARTDEILAQLDERLREAGYEVTPIGITPAADKRGYGFKGIVELRIPAGMKLDLEKYQPPPRPSDDALRTSALENEERGEA